MGELVEGIQALYDFMTVGAYTFIQEIFAELIIWTVTWWFKIKIASLTFMWGVAAAMMDQLYITALLDQYWGQLDSGFLGFMSRYKIPDAINLVVNAQITRFVWNLF